jgi:hypothetical protein
MTQTAVLQRGSEQTSDKNAIRSFHVDIRRRNSASYGGV